MDSGHCIRDSTSRNEIKLLLPCGWITFFYLNKKDKKMGVYFAGCGCYVVVVVVGLSLSFVRFSFYLFLVFKHAQVNGVSNSPRPRVLV